MSWIPGLCSISFRHLTPERIAGVAASAGLKAIEWGSDVHLPPGDTKRAAEVARLCAERELECPTLGSYARGTTDDSSQPFEPLLDTAEALGAKTIRVWAGRSGFAETGAAERERVAATIHAYAEAASARNLRVALEYHPNTLTDCRDGALWLLDHAAHPALSSYWQPVPDQPVAACRGDLSALGARLAHLHVFFWRGDRVRHPLDEGAAYWAQILEGMPVPEQGHAFLEFVPDDDVAVLAREARALRRILAPQAELVD